MAASKRVLLLAIAALAVLLLAARANAGACTEGKGGGQCRKECGQLEKEVADKEVCGELKCCVPRPVPNSRPKKQTPVQQQAVQPKKEKKVEQGVVIKIDRDPTVINKDTFAFMWGNSEPPKTCKYWNTERWLWLPSDGPFSFSLCTKLPRSDQLENLDKAYRGKLLELPSQEKLTEIPKPNARAEAILQFRLVHDMWNKVFPTPGQLFVMIKQWIVEDPLAKNEDFLKIIQKLPKEEQLELGKHVLQLKVVPTKNNIGELGKKNLPGWLMSFLTASDKNPLNIQCEKFLGPHIKGDNTIVGKLAEKATDPNHPLIFKIGTTGKGGALDSERERGLVGALVDAPWPYGCMQVVYISVNFASPVLEKHLLNTLDGEDEIGNELFAVLDTAIKHFEEKMFVEFLPIGNMESDIHEEDRVNLLKLPVEKRLEWLTVPKENRKEWLKKAVEKL